MKKFFSLLGIFIIPFTAMSQSNGDYRSRQDADWNDNDAWQIYNSGWNNTTSSPGSTSTVTIRNGHTINTNGNRSCGNLTITGELEMSQNNTLTVTGSISGNGTWTTGSNPRTIYFTGNWSFNGTSDGDGATAVANGTGAQNISGIVSNGEGTLTINKTSGAATLTSTFTIYTLNLTSGILNTSSTNLLIIPNNGATSGGNSNSFVAGPMRKVGNDAFTFPLGAAGAGLHTISISAPTGTGQHFTAEYVRASAATLAPVTASGVYGVSNCEYWRLNRTSGSGGTNVNVTIGWTATSGCGSAYVTTLTGLQVAAFNGTSWNTSAVNGNSGNTTAGTVTRNAFNGYGNGSSSFSAFALSNVNSNNGSPLPAIYGRVRAAAKNNNVKIDWEVLTEIEVSHYVVEHSTDGIHFNPIYQQTALANNAGRFDYSYLHQSPVAGINYYRIKSVEPSGKSYYTIIMKVDMRNGEPAIVVYPNPVKGNNVSLQLNNLTKSEYFIRVYNSNGHEIYHQTQQHSGGSSTMNVQLPAAIQRGVYQLVVNNEGNRFSKTFIVR
jgi:hypothetical protein